MSRVIVTAYVPVTFSLRIKINNLPGLEVRLPLVISEKTLAMKIVPIFYCSNMKEAIRFYTQVLDFTLRQGESADDVVVDLFHGDAMFQLTSLRGDQKSGFAINVFVDDVDARFAKYVARGLDTSGKKDSPVHQGPVDQSWGRREFYVTDADGNTLRFGQWI